VPMDDFIKERGLPFLAHLLRRLSDHFVKGFTDWNKEVGIKAPPRTHSTMQALHQRGSMSVTEIAALVRQSHPLVITWVRQLKDLGLVTSRDDPSDGRRSILELTTQGRKDVDLQNAYYPIIEKAFERLITDAGGDVFVHLWRMEELCRREPFLERLRREARSAREYSPK
jgi:MarR family transcriptional regulator, organic hydroperoxide resistance regulator